MKPLDSTLIKKAHAQFNYTEQLIEQVANCADPETGPEYFCRNFFYIQHPVRGRIQFQPFDFQVELLAAFHHYRQTITMVSRQMGKCVGKDINITVKNKTTGKIYELPVGIFHQLQRARCTNQTPPDISAYEKL